MGDHDNTEPLQALSHALFVAARDGNLAAFTAADDEAVFTAADPIAATKGVKTDRNKGPKRVGLSGHCCTLPSRATTTSWCTI